MGIKDSVANFVDRMRADIARQEYWNSQAALNSLQNQSTADPSVVRRIEQEAKAQQDAAMRYMQLVDAQQVRSGKEPSPMPASIEEKMGATGGGALTPVRREEPDTRKGDYSYPMTPQEEKQYAFASPAKVVSRKQFKTEEEWQNWLASKQASQQTDEEFIKGKSAETPLYGPQAETPAEKPKGEFIQASNKGAQNPLDARQPAPQKRPSQILKELEETGHHLDAQDFRYRLEQEDYKINMKRLLERAALIEQTQGEKQAKEFVGLYLPLIKEQLKTKPIEESEYFKSAQEELYNADTRKKFDVLANLQNELIEGEKMLRAGKKDQAVIYFKANIPKVLNFLSTYSPDALQDPEVTRLIPELQTFVDKGINPVEWAKKIQDTGVLGSFSRNPQAFLEKSKSLFNAAAKAQNKKFDFIKERVGETASKRLKIDQGKFQLFQTNTPGGVINRTQAVEQGIAPKTTLPPGAVRKSVSLQSIYP